ncbi:MAG: hypothetical protein LBG12_06485 [Synergistaceae bacterium]|jgi:hypothetical protein|nr:hypothetical protein [Synergistaceae bacterium]
MMKKADKERFRVFESFEPLYLPTKAIYDAYAAKMPSLCPRIILIRRE